MMDKKRQITIVTVRLKLALGIKDKIKALFTHITQKYSCIDFE